ncbi:sugar phosphate isomerase/epimerase family protein [Candidatus Merdisoma sp. JLR.KK006]|jgi:sugar phosphate isomerase/epimerase|uniref:sugar phosphate isomerase/epimerase family protein n=1 Tax=Candidatus Merdisoma sp. JLR.KK006 TaxID=3112626 RepID=UPI002FF1D7CA
MKKHIFPLCIQLNMPSSLKDGDFIKTMELLQSLGFYGVELNVTDFEGVSPDMLSRFLSQYDLKMTMLATGVYAKQEGLSLGSLKEKVRKKTVDVMCQTLVPFAEKMGCDLICGYIKGGADAAVSQLKKSIREISERIEDTKVNLYLEATNHYDSGIVHTVREAAELAGTVWRVLPDIYHMNMEETSMAAAIVGHSNLYRNIHISDNNRYFPGFGGIDFYQVFQLLKAISYEGTVSIEGRVCRSLREDIIKSCRYLESVYSRMETLD